MPFLRHIFFDSNLETILFLQSLLLSLSGFCSFILATIIIVVLLVGCWKTRLWLGLRGWKELLALAQGMSSYKKPMIDMEELMECMKNLSWEDVLGLMKVNTDRATDFEALTLVVRLVARKIIPKPVILPFIKVG